MGRYDIISPSEIFGMKETIRLVRPVKQSRSRGETDHDDKSDRSNKRITEKKTEGTCVEW